MKVGILLKGSRKIRILLTENRKVGIGRWEYV